MYKAAIFDLDGTIADTLTSIAYFGNATLKHFGFPEADREKYSYFAGNGYIKLVERALKDVGGYSEDTFDEICKFYHNLYDENPLYLTTPFEGICEMLGDMKKRGMTLAVISNKPHDATTNVVKELFGDDLFSHIIGGGSGFPLKPDPAAVLHVLSENNIKPNECIYVGDTATDMITGKKSGAFTIGVLWGFRPEKELSENGADLIVSKPSEITDYLKKA